MTDMCVCCGRNWPRLPDCRTEGGPMHFSCWEEHHSDPLGPGSHVCEVTP